MISLVDGDSISFILGWVHKEHQNVEEMHQSIDAFLDNIFTLTGADMYYGALAGDTKCFRYDTYKVKPYKGNRPEIQEHMEFWRPVVTDYLKDKWKFDAHKTPVYPQLGSFLSLEADDLIATAAMSLKEQSLEFVICGVDKDLKQIPGLHFNYRSNEFCTVDEHQARYNHFILMLEGDDSDGIAGIPGFGPKKAQEKLKPLLESQVDQATYEELVKNLYCRHFAKYYGDLIYQETEKTISLVWDTQREVKIHSVPSKEHPFEMMNQSH